MGAGGWVPKLGAPVAWGVALQSLDSMNSEEAQRLKGEGGNAPFYERGARK